MLDARDLVDKCRKITRERGSFLDPTAEDSPTAVFIRVLRHDMQKAEQDRDKQLKLATAALDLSDPNSLLNRLVNESQAARVQFLQALNLASPESPLAAIKASLCELLREHMKSELERAQAAEKRQREFEIDVRATLERLESRKTHDARSARGGVEFEQAVAEFARRVFSGAPMTVDAVGTVAGAIARCRTGDILARYTAESSYSGAALVIEAKHDASYTESRALAEMIDARKNRGASASNAEALSDHVRCGTRALGLLLRSANAVLAALTGRGEELDGAEPVSMKLALEPDAVAAEE